MCPPLLTINDLTENVPTTVPVIIVVWLLCQLDERVAAAVGCHNAVDVGVDGGDGEQGGEEEGVHGQHDVVGTGGHLQLTEVFDCLFKGTHDVVSQRFLKISLSISLHCLHCFLYGEGGRNILLNYIL